MRNPSKIGGDPLLELKSESSSQIASKIDMNLILCRTTLLKNEIR